MNSSNIESKGRSHVKQNTIRNTLTTFFACFFGAAVMVLIDKFMFDGAVKPLHQVLTVILIAMGVTLVFMFIRFLFHKK